VRRRYIVAASAALGALTLSIGVLTAGAGNGGNGSGAPSGPHYNLNLIGFADSQNTKSGNGPNGDVIFVPLDGHCQIDLTEGSFDVLDGNCSDGSDALYQLPNPDPTNSGTSSYSVFVATRGKPMGSATMKSCFFDTSTSTEFCAVPDYQLSLKRNFGPSTFQNVTKNLLYVYACVNGNVTRVPLFADPNDDYYWSYDNNGLRNAQLRFYPGVQTTVPDPTGATC